MLQLQPIAPWPLPLLVFLALVVIPGMVLANLALAGRKAEWALFGLLSLVLGLASVSGLAYLWVALSGDALEILALALPAVSLVAAGGVLWAGGRRVELERTHWGVWLGLASVALAAFLTHDPSVLEESAVRWVTAGRGNCFRLGTFQYLGLSSPIWKTPLPPLMDFWDGIMPGNLALSSLFTLVFGWPGFRLLRVCIALVLALSGYLLGKGLTGSARGGAIGLAVFGLSPFVLMVQDTDRNVMALAYGAVVFVLLLSELGTPLLLGLLVGFTAGLGLQFLPLVWLVPVLWHIWVRERKVAPVAVAGLAALVVAGLWLLRIGWYDPSPANPLYAYDMGLFTFHLQYRLGFPFYPVVTHGPFGTYPTALSLIFYVANTLGAIVVGLAALGGARLLQRNRAAGTSLLLAGLLPLLGLSLMVRIVPEQLRLAINCLLPVLALAIVGAQEVWSNWRSRRLQIHLSVSLLVCYLVLLGLAQVRVPADPRFDEPMPPAGRDPIVEYMTDEALARTGMGGPQGPGHTAPSATPGTPEVTSARLSAFELPQLLPDYRHLHPLSRAALAADKRWVDLQF